MRFDLMLLAAVSCYLVGDWIFDRAERGEHEKAARAGLLLVFVGFGLLCDAAVEAYCR